MPFLNENIDDEDEVLLAEAEQLGFFVPYVGGANHAYILLPLLENLSTVEETVVRDKAVESLSKVGAQLPDNTINDAFAPLVKVCVVVAWNSNTEYQYRMDHASNHGSIELFVSKRKIDISNFVTNEQTHSVWQLGNGLHPEYQRLDFLRLLILAAFLGSKPNSDSSTRSFAGMRLRWFAGRQPRSSALSLNL